MQKLIFAPYPTDLRPVALPDIHDLDCEIGYDVDHDTLYSHGEEERDSYEQEERELLFVAWCAEVDASDPPF